MNGDWRHKKAEKEEEEGGRLGASGGGGGDIARSPSVGDSNPLLFWECLSVCLPARPIVGMRLQVVFAVYLEQCSRAAINQIESLGEKRGERERRG